MTGTGTGEPPEAQPRYATGSAPDEHRVTSSPYPRFAAMIATSTIVMFGLTYTNSFSADHVRWSEERFYMALVMGSAMGIVMLGFMWRMHRNLKANVAIVLGCLLVLAGATFLSRSQVFVTDEDYMKGMIPHHSIAILTSKRADLDDVRVRELADEIIAAQEREIAEMDWLLADIAANGVAATPAEAAERPVPEVTGRP